MGAKETKADIDLSAREPRDPERGGRAQGPRSRPWWVLLVLFAVVVALVLIDARRSSEAGDARAGEVLADLSGGVEPLWELEGIQSHGPGSVVDELLLVWGADAGETVAVELDSGVERWRVAGVDQCGVAVGAPALVVCTGWTDTAGIVTWVDPATGEQTELLTVPGSVQIEPWHDGVLIATETTLSYQAADGSQRWEHRFAQEPVDPATLTLGVTERAAFLAVGEKASVLDLEGQVLAELSLFEPGSSAVDPVVGRVLADPVAGLFHVVVMDKETGGSSALAIDEAGETVVETEGARVRVHADDGSLGDVVVTYGVGGLTVWDRDAGEPLGTVPGSGQGAVLLLDGALVRVDGGRLTAVDVSSGLERWSVDAGSGQLVGTDGRLVLLHTTSGLFPALRAIDLEDGGELWAHELPSPAAWPVVWGGSLFVHDAETLTRLH